MGESRYLLGCYHCQSKHSKLKREDSKCCKPSKAGIESTALSGTGQIFSLNTSIKEFLFFKLTPIFFCTKIAVVVVFF